MTQRPPQNIGQPTWMVGGCKHFDLVVCFMTIPCKMRTFACILTILCGAEEDEIAFNGPQPWNIN